MSDLKLRRQAVVDLARSWAGPAPVAAKLAKKRVTIDALVAWSYQQELPKLADVAMGPAGYPQGWGKISEWSDELPLAGLDENRFGVVPDLTAQRGPHADAIAVHDAMLRLDEEFAEIELPEGWHPLADLDLPEAHAARTIGRGLAAATRVLPDGRRVMRRSPRQIVFRAAILGAPVWEIEAPVVRVELDRGKPRWFVREVLRLTTPGLSGEDVVETVEREVDGFDHRLRMPKPDAYQKTYLDPDPTDGVAARAEWEIWIAALDALREMLEGALEAHDALPCELPTRPWESGGVAPVRVLRDLRREPVRRGSSSGVCSGLFWRRDL